LGETIVRRAVLPALSLAGALITGALAGCTPVGMVAGAGASVGVSAASERGLSGTVDDTKLQTSIAAALIGANPKAFLDVSVNIYEGVVTLTGKVRNPQEQVDAVRVTWQVAGVRQVNDDIQVEDKSTLIDEARDIRIADTLKAQLFIDRDVKNINYTVDCVNGVVYLMGIAQNQNELDRVIGHARNIGGVSRVVNQVILKTDPSRVTS
jgi:osmotically-inducible protein OsmY